MNALVDIAKSERKQIDKASEGPAYPAAGFVGEPYTNVVNMRGERGHS